MRYFILLCILTGRLWATVEIQMVSQEGKIVHRQGVDSGSETLILYSKAGESLFKIVNLSKLPKLKSLIIPGGGFEILNDSFLNDVPQLESLIIKAAGVPRHWPNLKKCRNLKVFVLHYGSSFPDGLEFAEGITLNLVGLPGLDAVPELRGHGKIKYLDLSRGEFPIPGQGMMEKILPRIDIVYLDGFPDQSGPWIPANARFQGRDKLYEDYFPEAVM